MRRCLRLSRVGIMVIRDGVIVAKYHIDHLPYDRKFNNLQSVYLQDLEAQNVRLMILCIIFAVGLLLIPLYKKHKTL